MEKSATERVLQCGSIGFGSLAVVPVVSSLQAHDAIMPRFGAAIQVHLSAGKSIVLVPAVLDRGLVLEAVGILCGSRKWTHHRNRVALLVSKLCHRYHGWVKALIAGILVSLDCQLAPIVAGWRCFGSQVVDLESRHCQNTTSQWNAQKSGEFQWQATACTVKRVSEGVGHELTAVAQGSSINIYPSLDVGGVRSLAPGARLLK